MRDRSDSGRYWRVMWTLPSSFTLNTSPATDSQTPWPVHTATATSPAAATTAWAEVEGQFSVVRPTRSGFHRSLKLLGFVRSNWKCCLPTRFASGPWMLILVDCSGLYRFFR